MKNQQPLVHAGYSRNVWSITTHQEGAELQYCVWRTSPKAPLKLFLFLRMVMGSIISPGLARLTIQRNAEDTR